MTVAFQAEAMALLQGTTLRINRSPSPIDLDRSRNVHPAQIARKPAPMLDLIKVSVVLTVQVGLRAARPSVSEGVPAPLVFEWE